MYRPGLAGLPAEEAAAALAAEGIGDVRTVRLSPGRGEIPGGRELVLRAETDGVRAVLTTAFFGTGPAAEAPEAGKRKC